MGGVLELIDILNLAFVEFGTPYRLHHLRGCAGLRGFILEESARMKQTHCPKFRQALFEPETVSSAVSVERANIIY